MFNPPRQRFEQEMNSVFKILDLDNRDEKMKERFNQSLMNVTSMRQTYKDETNPNIASMGVPQAHTHNN